MIGYLIKTTYLEGPHLDKWALLTKGGYVEDTSTDKKPGTEPDPDSLFVLDVDAYASEAACRRVCSRKYKTNAEEREFELRQRERDTAKGLKVSPYRLHYLQSYEPFAVEIHPATGNY